MACFRTKKESALWDCARMILHDQCPPEREHYLCMKAEDDTPDCTLCWDNYLWGVAGDGKRYGFSKNYFLCGMFAGIRSR